MGAQQYVSNGHLYLEKRIADGYPVITDGGVSTTLEQIGRPGYRNPEGPSGSHALLGDPARVLDVHEAFIGTGCHVLTTDTFGLPSVRDELATTQARGIPTKSWLDIGRLGIQLPRLAIEKSGREGTCAVAFSLNANCAALRDPAFIEGLGNVFATDPPDLVLLETLTGVEGPETLDVVQSVLDLGYPVWLSFRRCTEGLCTAYGEHRGGPYDADVFEESLPRLDAMGVEALLFNCIPLDHAPGMVTALRRGFKGHVGARPNMGHRTKDGWHLPGGITPEKFAALALELLHEGATIIGGCCGVPPEFIDELVRVVGSRAFTDSVHPVESPHAGASVSSDATNVPVDEFGRPLWPIPFPEVCVVPDVHPLSTGSMGVWKFVRESNIGFGGESVLEIGSGCGHIAIQAALNGGDVYAIDNQLESVENTRANAARLGVTVTVTEDDILTYVPISRYGTVIMSPYQMPVPPTAGDESARDPDYYGRTLMDRCIRLLPELLEPCGRAYIMQLSILSWAQTVALAKRMGLTCTIADYFVFPMTQVFLDNIKQIDRVVDETDAYYYMTPGNATGERQMIASIVEFRRAAA